MCDGSQKRQHDMLKNSSKQNHPSCRMLCCAIAQIGTELSCDISPNLIGRHFRPSHSLTMSVVAIGLQNIQFEFWRKNSSTHNDAIYNMGGGGECAMGLKNVSTICASFRAIYCQIKEQSDRFFDRSSDYCRPFARRHNDTGFRPS